MPEVGVLNLTIHDNSEEAGQGLRSLAGALTRVQRALGTGMGAGLTELAGGIGNLVDRIVLGYVRDFIEYTIVYTLFKEDFAICNLADAFLTIGVIMVIVYLIYSMVLESRKEKEKKAAESAIAPAEPSSEVSPILKRDQDPANDDRGEGQDD